jgi:hypothetical protein
MASLDIVLVVLLKILTVVYDIITLPFYTIAQAPWRKIRENKESKVRKETIFKLNYQEFWGFKIY